MAGASPVTGTALTAGTLTYDALHGNTVKLADQTLGYDVADRRLTTTLTDGTTAIYLRDVTGRDLSLPGGVNVTLPAGTPATPGEASTWVFPNLHGDTILTTDGAGLRVGVRAS